MEELKTQGIVLRAIDYGDKDKIVTIYTEKYGRVSAILKGVRKITSKLKFASQPFCYAQFLLVGKTELKTLSQASEIISFFDITQSYTKMVCGSAMLEMVEYSTITGQSEPILFDALRTSLRLLCDTDMVPELILMRFAIGLFKISGYSMNLSTCYNCGKNLAEDKVLFDCDTGEFCCYKCSVPNYISVSPRAFEIMQKISKTPLRDLDNIFIMEDEAREYRDVIKANFKLRFGVELRSLSVSMN